MYQGPLFCPFFYFRFPKVLLLDVPVATNLFSEFLTPSLDTDSARAIARDWRAFCNYPHSPSGLIGVFWNPSDIHLSLLGQSDQVVHCSVQNLSHSWSCLLSIVYGDNCHSRREALWTDLTSYAPAAKAKPWLVVGD